MNVGCKCLRQFKKKKHFNVIIGIITETNSLKVVYVYIYFNLMTISILKAY